MRQCHGRCTRAHYATGAAYKHAPGDGPAYQAAVRPKPERPPRDASTYTVIGSRAGPGDRCPQTLARAVIGSHRLPVRRGTASADRRFRRYSQSIRRNQMINAAVMLAIRIATITDDSAPGSPLMFIPYQPVIT